MQKKKREENNKRKNKYCSNNDLARNVLPLSRHNDMVQWPIRGFDFFMKVFLENVLDTDQTKYNRMCYLATNQIFINTQIQNKQTKQKKRKQSKIP